MPTPSSFAIPSNVNSCSGIPPRLNFYMSILLTLVLSLLATPLTVISATIHDYEYRGFPFETFDYPYTNEDRVTISLLSPTPILPGTLNAESIPGLTYAISDGVQQFVSDNTNHAYISIYTEDSSGKPTAWHITVLNDVGYGINSIFRPDLFPSPWPDGDFGGYSLSDTGAHFGGLTTCNSDGWSLSVYDDVAPPVPEPATLFLVGTGLAGLLATRRLKRRNHN